MRRKVEKGGRERERAREEEEEEERKGTGKNTRSHSPAPKMEDTLKGKEDYIARLESRLLQQNEALRKAQAGPRRKGGGSKGRAKAKAKAKSSKSKTTAAKPKRSPLKSRPPTSSGNMARAAPPLPRAVQKRLPGAVGGTHTADVKWQEWRVSQALNQDSAPLPLQSEAIAALSSNYVEAKHNGGDGGGNGGNTDGEDDDLLERFSSITAGGGGDGSADKFAPKGGGAGSERAESTSSRTSRSSRAEAERAVLESLVMDEFSVNEIEGFTEKLHKNFLKFYKR